jgi:hypothetical protein
MELGYVVLQSTRTLCSLRSIINFKSEMIDSNRSIQSPYQNILVNKILYFLEFILYFFG